MHASRRFVTGLLTILLVVIPALAVPVQTIVLGSVTVTGSKRIPEEVAAAAGLVIGQPVSREFLESAMQHLGQPGFFAKLAYQYQISDGKMAVTLALEDANLVPCIFDNFPWFSDAELIATIRRQVPLFEGAAPENGSAVEQIVAALQTAIQPRAAGAKVEHIRHGTLGTHEWDHLFRVSGVQLALCAMRFSGVRALDTATLSRLGRQYVGKDYSRATMREFLKRDLLPALRQLGHLRASVFEGRAELSSGAVPSCTDSSAVVSLIAVEEGHVYSWGGARWLGSNVVPAAEADKCILLKSREVADGRLIDKGFDAVRERYGALGFLAARLTPTPRYDESVRVVSYDVEVAEGPQYRMGTLTVTGVPANVHRRLVSKWEMKPGDVFNASFLTKFLDGGPKEKAVRTEVRRNDETRTVDVVIDYQ